MQKEKRIISFLVKALISAAFFALLFSFVRTNDLLAMLGRIDWWYFLLSFLLVPVMLSTSCLKWKILLDMKEPKIPFRSLIRIYFIGYFFSNLLPSNVGGDVVRSFYTGRIIDNQVHAAVSVFMERFSGILFLIMLVILAPLLRPGLYANPYVLIPACAAAALLTVIVWVWMVRDPLKLPDRIISRILAVFRGAAGSTGFALPLKLVSLVERLYGGLYRRLQKFHLELSAAMKVIRSDRVLFVKIAAITVFFYFLTWVNVYVSFRAFGVAPDFLGICALVPTILFVAHLPMTVLGNLGFFETVFVLYFLLLDIPAAETLAMGLLLRVKMLCLGLVGYVVYLSYKMHRPGELRQLREFADRKERAGQGD